MLSGLLQLELLLPAPPPSLRVVPRPTTLATTHTPLPPRLAPDEALASAPPEAALGLGRPQPAPVDRVGRVWHVRLLGPVGASPLPFPRPRPPSALPGQRGRYADRGRQVLAVAAQAHSKRPLFRTSASSSLRLINKTTSEMVRRARLPRWSLEDLSPSEPCRPAALTRPPFVPLQLFYEGEDHHPSWFNSDEVRPPPAAARPHGSCALTSPPLLPPTARLRQAPRLLPDRHDLRLALRARVHLYAPRPGQPRHARPARAPHPVPLCRVPGPRVLHHARRPD